MGTLRLALHGLSLLAVASGISAADDLVTTEISQSGKGEVDDVGSPPLTMAEFEDGMLHAYATARDAFAALDATLTDLDAALDENPLDMKEFVRGTKSFKPPLTEEQATYAFKGLDVDHSGLVDVNEFVDGIKSGGFYRVTTTSIPGGGDAKLTVKAPITVADFKASMLKAYPSAPDAFAALDASETDLTAALRANPLNLEQFVKGAKTFYPPLTRTQAEYAFRALDADANGVLVSAEFSEGLARGEFHVPGDARLQAAGTDTTTVEPTSTATTTSTATATATTTTTAPLRPDQLPSTAFISMDDFKARMLTAHTTAVKAFQALGANPAGLDDFIRGVKTFEPPLSRDQAVYAFQGFDADHDQSVSSFEFFEVLEFGRFFPKLRDLVLLGSGGAADAAAAPPGQPLGGQAPGLPAGTAVPGSAEQPRGAPSSGAPDSGGYVLRAVALVTLCPVLCMLFPFARGVWQHFSAANQYSEPYRVVSLQSPAGAFHVPPLSPRHQKRPRRGGLTSFLSCCVQTQDDSEEQPGPAVATAPCMSTGHWNGRC
mmetsp:Transcript_43720/g.88149  ORF Transcript_43720/g.88149 Transcript_43720/m.88149 type:complete len:545 (+) Transcript_43720:203-1837(+)